MTGTSFFAKITLDSTKIESLNICNVFLPLWVLEDSPVQQCSSRKRDWVTHTQTFTYLEPSESSYEYQSIRLLESS